MSEVLFAADRLVLTSFRERIAIVELREIDAYSLGITEAAYTFVDVEYLEMPVSTDFVAVRIAIDVPERVPRERTVFEIFETDVVSEDGGMVVVAGNRVQSGREVHRAVGYVVASSCEEHHGELPSGNRRRGS